MTEVSKLYSSVDNIYQTESRRKPAKGKHGDVKHIVYKDGVPVKTEIIRVKRKKDPEEEHGSKRNQSRISMRQPRKSDESILAGRRKKLSERLKNAILRSQTLWSEGKGIWLSYQGNQSCMVKQFSPKNQLLSKAVMTQSELLQGDIPGLLEASWKVV